MVTFWCYQFTQVEDLCTVSYKIFDNSKDTIFPIVSLCFEKPVVAKKLKQINQSFNTSAYLNFLKGSIYEDKMNDINYDNVTLK